MKNTPYVLIENETISFPGTTPDTRDPRTSNVDSQLPTCFYVHHDLTLEVVSNDFTFIHKLTPKEAVSLIARLAYALDEKPVAQVKQ
jgi:hypothetical protein